MALTLRCNGCLCLCLFYYNYEGSNIFCGKGLLMIVDVDVSNRIASTRSRVGGEGGRGGSLVVFF